MWQKEHHSRSAVLLSSLKTLPSSQHTTWMYMYTHLSSLDTKFLHFFLTGPLMLSLSSYITHCPHFSIRAHFHFSHRHHQCPENPSFPITWAMVLKRMIQTSPRIYPAQLTGQKQGQSLEQGNPTKIPQPPKHSQATPQPETSTLATVCCYDTASQ